MKSGSLLTPVKIEIAPVAASSYGALPRKGDAAHSSVNAVIAQAERTGQFFAPQQFTVLHIGALQNIDFVVPAVGLDFCRLEARSSVEHSESCNRQFGTVPAPQNSNLF